MPIVKTDSMYDDILHLIYRDTNKKLNPAEVVFDSEFIPFSPVQRQFLNDDVVGCFFHYKQALRRRMKRQRTTEAEANIAMAPGMLDILTVVEPERVDPKSIAWVQQRIMQECITKKAG
ncbi:unnamed protein product [Phytophthora fragariaefolia]|uniref:Unnamed protein product n=1 Tax=Phytophthora fragariaefolia TaxID=1490495 RepID=A0A9W6YED9_9STRA|nr:unnamed protein product [Phytophthora fragariaefolia]